MDRNSLAVVHPAVAAVMVAIIVAMTLAGTAAAQDAGWSGKSEAGMVITTGNSETKSGNARFEAAYELDRWKHGFGVAALVAQDDTGTNAERYEARFQSDYKLTEQTFLFGALRYEDDHFTGFDYQATATAGVGRKFIDSETTKLIGQLGAGYRQLSVLPEKESEGQAIARGDVNFEHAFNESTKVIDKFLVEGGSDNSFVQNELSLQVTMTKTLALAVGYTVRHNTDPPSGLEKTDTVTTVNLVHQF
jgi:putative salt-induced outer membrane protein